MTRLSTDGMSAVTERKKWLCCSARGRVWIGIYSDPPALAMKRLLVPKIVVFYVLQISLSGGSIKSVRFQEFYVCWELGSMTLMGPFQFEIFYVSMILWK